MVSTVGTRRHGGWGACSDLLRVTRVVCICDACGCCRHQHTGGWRVAGWHTTRCPAYRFRPRISCLRRVPLFCVGSHRLWSRCTIQCLAIAMPLCAVGLRHIGCSLCREDSKWVAA